MRFAFLLMLSSLVVVGVHAEEAECDQTTESKLKPMIAVAAAAADEVTCPNRKKFKNLCGMVGSRTKDIKNSDKYMYETRIAEAACIEDKDSEEVRSEKIRKAWSAYEDDLKCNNTQFDVVDGHLLKYAITTYFEDFINDVIKWKVNLNKVDASDGRTVLDYIKYQMERNKGNALEPKFKFYYDKLKAAGAKHKSEL